MTAIRFKKEMKKPHARGTGLRQRETDLKSHRKEKGKKSVTMAWGLFKRESEKNNFGVTREGKEHVIRKGPMKKGSNHPKQEGIFRLSLRYSRSRRNIKSTCQEKVAQ